jgi:hypothetical protein
MMQGQMPRPLFARVEQERVHALGDPETRFGLSRHSVSSFARDHPPGLNFGQKIFPVNFRSPSLVSSGTPWTAWKHLKRWRRSI